MNFALRSLRGRTQNISNINKLTVLNVNNVVNSATNTRNYSQFLVRKVSEFNVNKSEICSNDFVFKKYENTVHQMTIKKVQSSYKKKLSTWLVNAALQ